MHMIWLAPPYPAATHTTCLPKDFFMLYSNLPVGLQVNASQEVSQSNVCVY
jgi:hypothetical protein